MRKLLIIFSLWMAVVLAFGQTTDQPNPADTAPTPAPNEPVTIATQDLDIQIKALIPDISFFKLKTDTYAQPGDYKYTINLEVIRNESSILLTNWKNEITKWLEESK